jgi:8-oxo-dGTP diphosphatase
VHLPVEREPALSEETCDPSALVDLVDHALAAREGVVLCTHRPVLPLVLGHLDIELDEPLVPGEMLVCHHRGERIVAAERVSAG